MDSVGSFFRYLQKFIDLSSDEFERYIKPLVVVRKFDKKTVVTKAGEVEEYFNFVLRGLARKYYKKEKEEVSIQIATEGHIIHAHESFHGRTPSEYFVETIEPTTFASISYNDLETIYLSGAKMERLGRLVVTYTMILRDKWQIQLIKLTPRERFLQFVRRNPALLQRVPQKYLASYLNIQPETFSRFKHLLKAKT